ncbi:MAG TPA: hypothetical protein VF669_10940 [Tepidisphaeraceae bacterium]|jgi:hypothetical protein
MKKETSNKSGAGKTSAPVVPVGDPRVTMPSINAKAAPALPSMPNWHRYADSRMKQFCSR